MWMQIKGSNAEIQDPFPFGTCFYFSAVAANQNFHLLSFCSVQVNLSSGAQGTVISAKKCTDEARLHVCSKQLPNMSTQLRENWTRKELNPFQLLYRNSFLNSSETSDYTFKMGFCFYPTCTLIKITISTVISCLSLLPPIPSSMQQDILSLNLHLWKLV